MSPSLPMSLAITPESALALCLATFVFAAIPGPGVTAVVSQALGRGLGPALFWGLGIVLGDAFYLLLAMLGLTWVAQQLGGAFVVLKWAGAAYLVYLGARCIWSSLRPGAQGSSQSQSQAPARRSAGARTFLGGFLVSLGNPKVVAFYCGFLPGFVDLSALSGLDMACVALVILPTCYSVIALYAWLASRGRNIAGSGRLRLALGCGAGAVMIGTGVALITADAAAN